MEYVDNREQPVEDRAWYIFIMSGKIVQARFDSEEGPSLVGPGETDGGTFKSLYAERRHLEGKGILDVVEGIDKDGVRQHIADLRQQATWYEEALNQQA